MIKKNFICKAKLIILSLGLVLSGAVPSFSQASKLNFGLSQKQDPSTLPVSKAKPKPPVRKAKLSISPSLVKTSECEYIITSGWELAEAFTKEDTCYKTLKN